MKLLLDTHVFICWTSDYDKLSSTIKDLLIDFDNTLLLSFVSV